MESKNNSLDTNMPHRPISLKIFLGGLAVLVILCAGYFIYKYFFGKHKVPEKLTPEQKTVIIEQLNNYAAEHPLTDAERYQLITGKTQSSTTTATTTAKTSKVPAKKVK